MSTPRWRPPWPPSATAADRVVGATLKLWGGASDSGCCSVADVEDARRVADQLGLVHHVFNFAAEFEEHVVDSLRAGSRRGPHAQPVHRVQPAPQVRPPARSGPGPRLRRAWPPATMPGARPPPTGRFRLCRGADPAKDQSYVLAMLGQDQLARTLFPVGEMTKAEVRAEARRRGSAHGRQARQPGRLLHPVGRGAPGIPRSPAPPPRRPAGRPCHRGRPRRGRGGRAGDGGPAAGDGPQRRRSPPLRDRRRRPGPAGAARACPRRLTAGSVALHTVTWVDGEPAGADGPGRRRRGGPAIAQCSAHGRPVPCLVVPVGRRD